MSTILHGVVVLGAVQSLFLATLLLNRLSNNASNRVYASILVLASLALALAALMFSGLASRYPWIYLVEEPVSWLFGPLVFLYARTLLTSRDTVRVQDSRHFLVFFVNLAVVVPLFWWEPAAQLERVYSDALVLPTLLRFGHGVAYSGVALAFVLRNRSRTQQGQFRWVLWFIGLTGSIWLLGAGVFLAELAGAVLPYPFQIATPLAGTLVIYVCGYLSLGQPAVFAAPAEQAPTASPALESSERVDSAVTRDMERIVAELERKCLWRDQNLTLDHLARQVGLPAYRVTRAINTARNESFFLFINRYRVAEVQRVLEKDPTARLLDTAIAAGFSTKSSFNAAFKRFAGTTPSQYRRRIGTSLPNSH